MVSKKMKGGKFVINSSGETEYVPDISPTGQKPFGMGPKFGQNIKKQLPTKAEPPKSKRLDYGDTMRALEEYKNSNPSTGISKKKVKQLTSQDYFDPKLGAYSLDPSGKSKKSWRSSRLGGRFSPRNLLNKVDNLGGVGSDNLVWDGSNYVPKGPSSGSRYQEGTEGYRQDMINEACDNVFEQYCKTNCSKTRKFGRNKYINPAKCEECIGEHQDKFNYACQDTTQFDASLRNKRITDRIESTANKPKDCKEAKDQACGKHLNAFRPNYSEIEKCMREKTPYMKKYGCSEDDIDSVIERKHGQDYRKSKEQKDAEEVSGIRINQPPSNIFSGMQIGERPSPYNPPVVTAFGGARRRRRTKRRKPKKSKKSKRTRRTRRQRR